jgi:hypothetical protein
VTAAPELAQPMRILSMREPWLFAVLHLGKLVENRKWNTHYRGPILLHRSKGTKVADVSFGLGWMQERHLIEPRDTRWPGLENLPRGGICGYAEIADVIRPESKLTGEALFKFHDADVRWWMREQFGFVLKNVRPLPFIPWPGALSLFKAPDVLSATCLGALAGVCPCESDLVDPGPTHLATCRFADPDFDEGGVL